MGTGRCGTYSLASLFQEQRHVRGIHEHFYLRWVEELTDSELVHFWHSINEMQDIANVKSEYGNNKLVASVSYGWISYIPEIMKHLKHPRCICLKRKKSEVIDSLLNYKRPENRWTCVDSKHFDTEKYSITDKNDMFPCYDLPIEKTIGAYWDDYYRRAEFWQKRFPDAFKIFPISSLNSKRGVTSILNFAEIPKEDRVVEVGVKLNTREVPRGKVVKMDGDIVDLTGERFSNITLDGLDGAFEKIATAAQV